MQRKKKNHPRLIACIGDGQSNDNRPISVAVIVTLFRWKIFPSYTYTHINIHATLSIYQKTETFSFIFVYVYMNLIYIRHTYISFSFSHLQVCQCMSTDLKGNIYSHIIYIYIRRGETYSHTEGEAIYQRDFSQKLNIGFYTSQTKRFSFVYVRHILKFCY